MPVDYRLRLFLPFVVRPCRLSCPDGSFACFRSGLYDGLPPYSLLMRSGRPIRLSSLSMLRRSSGLYQKKNWRCASFSRGDLALNTGSSVYGSYPVYHASVLTVIGVGVKSCTCSRWKSSCLVFTASSAMSSSRHPG